MQKSSSVFLDRESILRSNIKARNNVLCEIKNVISKINKRDVQTLKKLNKFKKTSLND